MYVLKTATAAAALMAVAHGAAAQTMGGMTMPADPPVQSTTKVMATPSASGKDDGMSMPPPRHGWMVMTHGAISLVGDNQTGPRGGDKTFVEGMVMIMASHALDDRNTVTLDAMLSPDAFMGKSGYPLLLQTGETADSIHPLVDRQHPHDLIAGLSATLSHRVSDDTRAFVTVGYPGEFAFGPTAFMHRASGQDFPTAPISHHWLDSGHITMGVVTAGIAKGPLTLEVSQFTGREPDQNRFDLDPVRLDSTAARLSWQIIAGLKAQASWARQISPEQLEPGINLDKRSLSLEYNHGPWASTLAYGWRHAEHSPAKTADAYLFENALRFSPKWQGLLRVERVYNDELAPRAYWVAKVETGAIRTFDLNHNTSIGLGVVEQVIAVPDALKPTYGGHPNGTVAFVTLKFHNMTM